MKWKVCAAISQVKEEVEDVNRVQLKTFCFFLYVQSRISLHPVTVFIFRAVFHFIHSHYFILTHSIISSSFKLHLELMTCNSSTIDVLMHIVFTVILRTLYVTIRSPMCQLWHPSVSITSKCVNYIKNNISHSHNMDLD